VTQFHAIKEHKKKDFFILQMLPVFSEHCQNIDLPCSQLAITRIERCKHTQTHVYQISSLQCLHKPLAFFFLQPVGDTNVNGKIKTHFTFVLLHHWSQLHKYFSLWRVSLKLVLLIYFSKCPYLSNYCYIPLFWYIFNYPFNKNSIIGTNFYWSMPLCTVFYTNIRGNKLTLTVISFLMFQIFVYPHEAIHTVQS
jgi:hypothetical protein